jgi:hypothetical protein
MHFDTMLIPELLYELAIPDDAVESHALCLKELLALYPSLNPFAKGGTLTPSGRLTQQEASPEYQADSQSTLVLSIVTHTTNTR